MKYEISLMDNSFYEYLTSTLRYNGIIERINKICNVLIDSVNKMIHRLSDLFDDLLCCLR